MTEPGTDATRDALAAERLRSARLVALLCFAGISIAFAMNLIFPWLVPEA